MPEVAYMCLGADVCVHAYVFACMLVHNSVILVAMSACFLNVRDVVGCWFCVCVYVCMCVCVCVCARVCADEQAHLIVWAA